VPGGGERLREVGRGGSSVDQRLEDPRGGGEERAPGLNAIVAADRVVVPTAGKSGASGKRTDSAAATKRSAFAANSACAEPSVAPVVFA
jgi:hypothetical protein